MTDSGLYIPMRFLIIVFSCVMIIALAPLSIAEPPEKPKTVLTRELQEKVDETVERGITSLLSTIRMLPEKTFNQLDYHNVTHTMRYDELVLYTLAHCGAVTQEQIKDLIDRVLELPLDRTYHVAVQAMALGAVDRVKYQARIADCAQFLVDNQCANGQWDYGVETLSKNWEKVSTDSKKVKSVITGGQTPANSPTPTAPAQPDKNTSSQKIGSFKITRAKPGRPTGDNSNTQYAILGLKACREANIDIPDDTFRMAKKSLESSQSGDGGWNYTKDPAIDDGGSYGSMTIGALGSLYIVKFYLNEIKPGQKDKPIEKAINWMANNFTVSTNPQTNRQQHYYYYMYALERAGVLSGFEKFGDHNWYLEGCAELVKRRDWSTISDTCFVLLFLKRATTPLNIKKVITGQ